jgi:hypothetical protein
MINAMQGLSTPPTDVCIVSCTAQHNTAHAQALCVLVMSFPAFHHTPHKRTLAYAAKQQVLRP